ncbi:MAG: hypothetical protein HY260_00730, partial [Chloroflexi bacterium]|nr:hypothetical protein [Chloroflexota bacterium]
MSEIILPPLPEGKRSYNPVVRRLLALALISAATLLYELALTRLLAVAQFHHFAFMLISLGLLGSAASGTILALRPSPLSPLPLLAREERGEGLAFGFSLSAILGYLVLNYLPFDSFSITWDSRQSWLLAFNFLVLAVPFLFSGLMVGAALVEEPSRAHQLYAANLIGSAAGCALVVLVPPMIGGERTVVFAAWLGAGAGVVSQSSIVSGQSSVINDQSSAASRHTLTTTHWSLITAHGALLTLLTLALLFPPPFLTLRLSPYKPLAQALLYPGARIALERWSASARVNVVESRGIRSLPGLSYTYLAPPPPQHGLAIDGDALAPITNYQSPTPQGRFAVSDLQFVEYLPESLAFSLHPGANALVIEPGGGLDVLVALASGARHVTALHGEPLAAEI